MPSRGLTSAEPAFYHPLSSKPSPNGLGVAPPAFSVQAFDVLNPVDLFGSKINTLEPQQFFAISLF